VDFHYGNKSFGYKYLWFSLYIHIILATFA
jgi:hypothetical protein